MEPPCPPRFRAPITRTGRNPLKVDAAILHAFNLPRGYWEAKDEKDDLMAEMNKKFAEGYPRRVPGAPGPSHLGTGEGSFASEKRVRRGEPHRR
jgi:hypothetical protein